MVTCPSGHRAYSGYLAEAAYLRPRLQWLDDRITAGDPAPDPEVARAGGIWAAPGPGEAGAPGTATRAEWPTSPKPYVPQPGHGGPGLQTLLLGLGAALLIIAGVVFTAVVWDRLGVGGHVAIMAVATLGFAGLAVRLTHRLPATAEALACVAFGLAVIDVVAAPALGLVPDSWLDPEVPYLSVVAVGLAAAGVLLGHRCALRAWVWLGWVAAALAGAAVTWFLALGPADGRQPWAAVSVTVVALTTVALAAGPVLDERLRRDQEPMVAASILGLLLSAGAWLAWLSDLDRPAIAGTAVTTVISAAAAAWVWRHTSSPVAGLCAVVLVGIVGGLVLLLPLSDAAWLAVVAALAGAALLAGFVRAGLPRAGLVGSAALWSTWGLGSVAIGAPEVADDPVFLQLSLLLAVVSASWFVLAALGVEPWIAWPAAGVGELALVAAGGDRLPVPDLGESWTLPLAALLLLAGYLWHRSDPGPSLGWLGPGVSVAVLPSALLCWSAPWVAGFSEQTDREALVRLGLVLLVGVGLVVAGVRLRLTGLFVPGVAALAIAGLAQLWGTALAMPRWLGIGLAGATVLLVGARLEWLRGRGRRVRSYLGELH